MTRAALGLFAAFVAAAALFGFWPGLDLAVSALFHDPVGGWAGVAPAANFLREAIWTLSEVFLAACLLLFALALARHGRAAVPARVWGFGALAMALGPGLLVNGILKAHWGRARPRSVAEFGGSAEFTPFWRITEECAANCSFVAGEAAAAATLALVLWLIAARRAPAWLRPWLGTALAALVLTAGALRIAAGGHFLSDVVFAVLVTAATTLALWRLMAVAPAADRLTRAAIAADLAAVAGLVRHVSGALRRGGKRPK